MPGDNQRKIKLIENASTLGLKYYAIPQATVPKSFKRDSGLLILSRFPIIASEFFLFNNNELNDSASGI
jgi:hypothetical protein